MTVIGALTTAAVGPFAKPFVASGAESSSMPLRVFEKSEWREYVYNMVPGVQLQTAYTQETSDQQSRSFLFLYCLIGFPQIINSPIFHDNVLEAFSISHLLG